MDFAEQEARKEAVGTMELSTNVMMVKNVAFYGRLMFVELVRRVEDGFERVFFEKDLV